MTAPRVALVCDWLNTVGGAESVLLALHEMYPDAPIYTSKYDEKGIDWFKDADIRTGWLQTFPNSLRRFIGPLRQFYFSHLDLSDYDLVISVTGAEAKAVRTRPKTRTTRTKQQKPEQPERQHCNSAAAYQDHHCVHICYCHVPTQYYWGMYDSYLKNPGFSLLNPLARLGLKLLIKPLRQKDFLSAQAPDYFVTISTYASSQIKKYYKRESTIINPPADLKKFSTKSQNLSTAQNNKKGKSQAKIKHSYITTSRQVNWKRLDLCVLACLETGDNLTLVGDGPEHENLVRLAAGAPNIHFLSTMSQSELALELAKNDAFLFPSLEPFGLAPVEAMAVGLPVIALKQGGALDYVQPGKNGLFFDHQSVASLKSALLRFDPTRFTPATIKDSVKKYDKPIFKQKMQEFINAKIS